MSDTLNAFQFGRFVSEKMAMGPLLPPEQPMKTPTNLPTALENDRPAGFLGMNIGNNIDAAYKHLAPQRQLLQRKQQELREDATGIMNRINTTLGKPRMTPPAAPYQAPPLPTPPAASPPRGTGMRPR